MIFQIGWRNLWRNTRRTAVILTAIIVGIISMVVLSAFGRGVMEGMVNNAINNLVGHIKIYDSSYGADPAIENRIRQTDTLLADIVPVLPEHTTLVKRLRIEGLLSTSRDNVGVEIVGIEPEKERGISFIGRQGQDRGMLQADDKNGLIIGQALLERLGLATGKKVVILCQADSGETSSKAFRIRGTYRTELRDTEKRYVFVNLDVLQRMSGVGSDVTEFSLTLENGGLYHAGAVNALANQLHSRIDAYGVDVLTWRQLLPAIRAYIDMFDVYMLIWFVVVFIAMGFGLANTVLMAVYERMREFGLQRALGMRSSRIIKVVMVEVLLLLVIGILLANGISLVLVKLVFKSGINLGLFAEGIEMFGIDRIIYPVLTMRDIVTANGVVLALGMVVGLYPAVHAARFTPVETMRHI